jgi:hypothetical protein
MKSFYRSLCFVGSILLLTHVATAQEDAQKGKHFRIACWSEWAGDDIFIRVPKKGEEEAKDGMLKIEILDMSYSAPYPYLPGKPLQFFKKTADAKEPYAPVMDVVIPDSNKDPLVMLILGRDKISKVVYDLDPGKFPFGSYKVVNFTNEDLAAEVAGKRFKLKPRGSELVNPSSKEEKAIQFKVAANLTEKPKVVYSSMMMNLPKKRMLMFFFPVTDEAGRGTIKCRSLVDFAPTVTEETQ